MAPMTWQSEDVEPMNVLIEMGFANRNLNEQLLKKFDNDVHKTVAELIKSADEEWRNNR